MRRIKINERENYKKKLEELAFEFHSLDNVYWDESAYYEFSMPEILAIEKATNELNDLMLKAVQYVIDNKLYDKMFINPNLVPIIERSWNEEEPSVYGRFDLAFDGGKIKMLEFNADTPTSLYEAAVVQWYWLQDIDKSKDQFNSIHEKLIDYWQSCREYFNSDLIHFASVKDSIEDFTTVEYMRDTATQAGLNTKFIYVSDIGWNDNKKSFTDLSDFQIKNIFKLYPWEWLSNEEFGDNLHTDANQVKWIEPAWKAVLSNKAILPILWELFPNCEYLLPAYFENENQVNPKNFIKKPIYSREGANITIIKEYAVAEETFGEYGEEGFIYQELFDIPDFDGNYPVIGSWLINQESAGIGIRESNTLITNNFSRFIPHLIK